jgi:pyruvate/2-oxoglutarate/acetoin dehydrogenase E1 component
MFLEHKHLYRRERGEVPEGEHAVPIGEARVVRAGAEMTILAYGSTVSLAQQAVDELGEDVEIVDLRTLCPLDRDAILQSVRKTGKVLVAHEATRSCGVGAELSALIAEEAFEDLDALSAG